MILEIDGWKFDVDMEATMEYSSNEAKDYCNCAYCRNFYAAVDNAYPNLRPFLAQFGLNIEAPDELMPFDMEDRMDYDGVYAVAGRILHVGDELLQVDGLRIAPELDSQIDHSQLEPCFYLAIDNIQLPWVLDEPMKDVVSPANFPSFLKKMWNKLLGRQPKSDITS